MKVKMLTSIAGARFAAAPGEIVDMNDAEAKRFLLKGLAEKCDQKEDAHCSIKTNEKKKKRHR